MKIPRLIQFFIHNMRKITRRYEPERQLSLIPLTKTLCVLYHIISHQTPLIFLRYNGTILIHIYLKSLPIQLGIIA